MCYDDEALAINSKEEDIFCSWQSVLYQHEISLSLTKISGAKWSNVNLDYVVSEILLGRS